ncbi:MAG: hypothetical protein AB7F41_05895 [Methylocystis sp.]|uniref:hypothetical protein n=1 Tax=Methylocystis sp. TaxID=1911079 RepID=UPI003D14FAC8
MPRILLSVVAALAAMGSPALAMSQNWNITEENVSGVKGAQGTWSVNTDADNKITGTANLQLDNGKMLTYALSGSVQGAVYKIEMSERSDGKKGCVWNGHIPAGADKSHGLIGEAVCDGGVKLIIRAGF